MRAPSRGAARKHKVVSVPAFVPLTGRSVRTQTRFSSALEATSLGVDHTGLSGNFDVELRWSVESTGPRHQSKR